jgi:flagellar biosynthetic protein FliQ
LSDGQVLGLFVRTLLTAGEILAPIVGMVLAVGLTTSVIQAAMQLQDPTVTYVPRLIAAAAAVVVFGAWMLGTLVQFSSGVLDSLGTMVLH